MGIIHPKRQTKTGDLYHYCPKFPDSPACPPLPPECEGCTVEQLTSRYRVHCAAQPETQIRDFEPPKAHDNLAGMKGVEVCRSARHTWIERKLDGVRALVHITPDGIIITSRRRDKTGQFSRFQDNVPHLRDHPALMALGQEGYTILDGEVIWPDTTPEQNSLGLTMGVVGSKPARAVETQRKAGKFLVFNVFDIIQHCDEDVSAFPLRLRRDLLEGIFQRFFPVGPLVQLVDYLMGTEAMKFDAYAQQIEAGYEGIITKDPNAGYFDSRAWLKVKQKWTVDAVVTGWEYGIPGGKYGMTVGALKVSAIDAETGKLREICKVIPGDDAKRVELMASLNRYRQDGSFWKELTDEEILELGMIVELESQLLSEDGRLRHPRILRYRTDRSTPNTVDFATRQVVG